MVDRLLTGLFFVYFVITSTILVVVAVLIRLVTQPFDKNLRLLHLFTCFWGSLYLRGMPAWRVTIEGREHVRKGITYVMVANHGSTIDIPVLFRLFVHFKWVAKEELFRVPFIGWALSLNRYIRIKRGDLDGIRQMMQDCRAALRAGSSVLIFPEGTRSETAELRPFLSGAFTLAKRAQVPILPIVIHGSRDALPKKSLVIRGRHHIRVRVLPELPYELFAEKPVKTWAAEVRARIADELSRMDEPEQGEADRPPDTRQNRR
jgi:1-acyl-sn-glycerol-3-phosphate acyltransferase